MHYRLYLISASSVSCVLYPRTLPSHRFPTASSSFPEAVRALTSGAAGVPEGTGPLTATCDLCGVTDRLLVLQAETEDEELAELVSDRAGRRGRV